MTMGRDRKWGGILEAIDQPECCSPLPLPSGSLCPYAFLQKTDPEGCTIQTASFSASG